MSFAVCSGQNGVSINSISRDFLQKNDTFVINSQQLILTIENARFQSLTTLSGDSILKDMGYYSKVEFIDIDADGYKDIRAFVVSNTSNQCENYLFDKKQKAFRLLQNCDLDIQLIEGTKFYYSYNGAGCGNLNWESYMGRIGNCKFIPIAYINRQGCDFDIQRKPQEILIYKITDPVTATKILVSRLPYTKFIPQFGDKWKFIESYWQKNWVTFAT